MSSSSSIVCGNATLLFSLGSSDLCTGLSSFGSSEASNNLRNNSASASKSTVGFNSLEDVIKRQLLDFGSVAQSQSSEEQQTIMIGEENNVGHEESVVVIELLEDMQEDVDCVDGTQVSTITASSETVASNQDCVCDETICHKRPAVLDAVSITYWYDKDKLTFSGRAIYVAVEHWLEKGYVVALIMPKGPHYGGLSKEVTDRYLIDMTLEKLKPPVGVVVEIPYSPDSFVGPSGSRIVRPYNECFMLQYAHKIGGFLVTNDRYLDLKNQQPEYQDMILKRVSMFTWGGDIFLPTHELHNNRHFPPGVAPLPLFATNLPPPPSNYTSTNIYSNSVSALTDCSKGPLGVPTTNCFNDMESSLLPSHMPSSSHIPMPSSTRIKDEFVQSQAREVQQKLMTSFSSLMQKYQARIPAPNNVSSAYTRQFEEENQTNGFDMHRHSETDGTNMQSTANGGTIFESCLADSLRNLDAPRSDFRRYCERTSRSRSLNLSIDERHHLRASRSSNYNNNSRSNGNRGQNRSIPSHDEPLHINPDTIECLNEAGQLNFSRIRSILSEENFSDAIIIRVMRQRPAVRDVNQLVNIVLDSCCT